MKCLSILRTQMNLIGVLRCDSTKLGKKLLIISNCLFFGTLLVYLTTTSWYFIFGAHEPLEYAASSYFVITSTTIMLMYLEMFRNRNGYGRLFKDLDSIVAKSKRDQLKSLSAYIWYHFLSIRNQTEFNNQTDLFRIKWKYWKSIKNNIFVHCKMLYNFKFNYHADSVFFQIHFFRVQNRTFKAILPGFVSSFFWILPSFFFWIDGSNGSISNFRYPFSWQTPFGFLASTLIQTLTSVASVEAAISSFVFLCGMSLITTTFVSEISQCLHEFNEDLKSVKKRKCTMKEEIEKKRILCDIIQFHSEAVELSVLFIGKTRLHFD